MEFKEKIDAVLASKKVALWKLAELASMVGTLEKAYRENREMRDVTTWKLLDRMKISPVWWKTGQGEIFVHNNVTKAIPDAQRIIDPGGDYIYVHRRAFEMLEDTLRQTSENLERIVATNQEMTKSNVELIQLAHTLAEVLKTGENGKPKTAKSGK